MPPAAKRLCVCVFVYTSGCCRVCKRGMRAGLPLPTSSTTTAPCWGTGKTRFRFIFCCFVFLQNTKFEQITRLYYLSGPSSPNMLRFKFFSFLGWLFHLGLPAWRPRGCGAPDWPETEGLKSPPEVSCHCSLLTVTPSSGCLVPTSHHSGGGIWKRLGETQCS